LRLRCLYLGLCTRRLAARASSRTTSNWPFRTESPFLDENALDFAEIGASAASKLSMGFDFSVGRNYAANRALLDHGRPHGH